MKTFAFIFARGGSKGLPNKNILNLCGKPLISYSIRMAQSITQISKVFVSTDDKRIAKIGAEYGAEIIQRPFELATDDSPEWMSWTHAITWLEERGESFDCFLSLPTTSPLRVESDVLNCLKLLDENTDIVLTITEASRSPYFNMVKKDQDYIKLFTEDGLIFSRRQDVPEVFDMTTVAYVAHKKFIKNNNKIFDGRVKAALIPKERSIDIDDYIDFKLAELLMKERMEESNA